LVQVGAGNEMQLGRGRPKMPAASAS
jgi:hypothetical protein